MSENNDEAKIEYVEDYLSDDVIDRVEAAISKILDDEDFFTSVFSLLDSDEEAEKMLRYLNDTPNVKRRDLMIFLFRMKNSRTD